jgi:hypothetical protein
MFLIFNKKSQNKTKMADEEAQENTHLVHPGLFVASNLKWLQLIIAFLLWLIGIIFLLADAPPKLREIGNFLLLLALMTGIHYFYYHYAELKLLFFQVFCQTLPRIWNCLRLNHHYCSSIAPKYVYHFWAFVCFLALVIPSGILIIIFVL